MQATGQLFRPFGTSLVLVCMFSMCQISKSLGLGTTFLHHTKICELYLSYHSSGISMSLSNLERADDIAKNSRRI